MTGLVVFLLTAAGCLVLQGVPQGRHPRRWRPSLSWTARPYRRAGADAELAWQLPVVVRQLASLLKSGRTPAAMWQDMARVYGVDVPGPGTAGAGPSGTGSAGAGLPGAGPVQAALAAVLGPRIRAAGRAAELGLSVADALRRPGGASGHGMHRRFDRAWTQMAACWEASELTGAPLAVLLENYADHLQQELDADAARRTALAGPRATSALLGWLPLLGLGLGMLMGVDPLGTLLGTPAGRAALAAGAGLLVLARVWSRRLVDRAAGGQDAP
jgi:tight adherence protein B